MEIIKYIHHLLHQFNEVNIHKPFSLKTKIVSEPGQLESPRYTNRSFSLTSTMNSTLSNTNEVEQLNKDFLKLKSSMNEMKLKLTDQIQDLVNELDEEKKARATLQIEIERLQKLVQKTSRVNP